MKMEFFNWKDYVKWWIVEYFGIYGIYFFYCSLILCVENEVVIKFIYNY